MSPNKQGRKQRTRGKNNNNVARERTVLTLAEDPASAPPYMLPTQPPFPPNLGNMFAPFHQQQGQQQPPGVSIPDMPSFPFQQQPNMMHPFGQGSPIYHMQQAFHNQNQAVPQQQQQQNSAEMSDLEKLRKLQKTILDGQHPFFRAVPNPEALASVFLGPSPASQAYQQQGQQQQHAAQTGHGLGSLSQSQSENANAGPPKPDTSLPPGSASVSNDTKRPQTPNTSSGLGTSRTSGSLLTPQSMPPGASLPSAIHHQASNATNGTAGGARNDSSSGRPHPNVTIPPKTHDFRTNTPSPLPPNSAKASAAFAPQQHQRGSPSAMHSSSASGANHEQGRVPPPLSATSTSSLTDGAGDKPSPGKDGIAAYREAHPNPAAPGPYDRDRDRDRDRPGYTPYDAPRYSQASDRRDSGRYVPRHPDSRFDRDRDWERGRDWERDRERDREREREREKERERDRERRRVEDKPVDERRLEYERSSRPPADRRPPSPSPVEQKSIVPPDQRPVPGLGPPPPELRRPEVPVHPDQRRSDVPPHPEQQQRRPDPVVPRAAPPPPPPSVEQRRSDGSILPFSNQSLHDRDRSRPPPGAPFPRSAPLANPGTPAPPPRPEQRPVLAPSLADDRGSHRSALPDQRAPTGNIAPRPGPPSPENNRRPESANLADRGAGRPPAGSPMDDSGASRSMPERRLTHPGDPPPPPRASVVPESRAGQGHDDRDASRPFYSRTTAPLPPRAISRAVSPGSRRPDDSSYDASRDRDRPAPATTYREPPPPPPPPAGAPSRGYPEDLRRQSLETNASRRLSDNYYPPPPVPVPPVIDRRETEARQWRERESYPSPPASYSGTDAERERARRYPEPREWHGEAYGRERDPRPGDIDVHTRGRPPPPASWDRDRPVDARDKDKERDRYEGWSGVERKYPVPDASAAPPPPPPLPRWEDPAVHAHRPLHTRLTDTYDDRFIPRDAAERARYPPPSPSEDVPMRDTFRENPRVRPRSPSPAGRPSAGFDDAHRAPKRAREEYDTPPRPPYYDDARRPGPAPDYPPRVSSPPPYYDPRAPALVGNPRDPSPYGRDRAPDPYSRRDMPPPRSPPYYGRERYPPR